MRKLASACLLTLGIVFGFGGNAVAPAAAAETPIVMDGSVRIELAFWQLVKQSDKPEDLVSYLVNFPDGLFVETAISRYEQLTGKRLEGAYTAAALETPGTALEKVISDRAAQPAITKVQKAQTIKRLSPSNPKKLTVKKTGKTDVAKLIQEPSPQQAKRTVVAKPKQCFSAQGVVVKCGKKVTTTRPTSRLAFGGRKGGQKSGGKQGGKKSGGTPGGATGGTPGGGWGN